MTPSHRHRSRAGSRGYALIMVIAGGLILSVLAVTLLRVTGGEKADHARQVNTVRALYAAESAVAVGIDELRTRLEENANPPISTIAQPALPGVSYDDFAVNYVNPNANYAVSTLACTYPDDTPCGTGSCSVDNVCRYASNTTLAEGDYAGLTALQIPIQVLASVDISGAKAVVADIVELNLVPIFQFGLFFDGDMVFDDPPTMDIKGIAHTNGHFVPWRSAFSDNLRFHERVTAAGYVKRCSIHRPSQCFDGGDNVQVWSSVSSSFVDITQGKEDHGSDANLASYLETTFGDRLKDQTRGVEPLTPPIRVTGTLSPVPGRPEECGTLSTYAAPQAAGVEIIKRPPDAYAFTNMASNAWGLQYGPVPTTSSASLGLPAPPDYADCSGTTPGAHCQEVPRSVPRITTTQSLDVPGVASERFFWKAHIRIIDGIWYRRDGTVIFDPEAWDLSGVSAITDATFRRAMKYARVTRYSWFWDPRENRVYTASPEHQRGMQIRTTDFDVFAFKMLLKDLTAVTEIFGGSGIPSAGVVVYISESFDPHFDDPNYPGAASANIRNFLNFHNMENDLVAAEAADPAEHTCWQDAAAPTRGEPGRTPCQIGWHPYFIWGNGAQTLEGGPEYVSLTPNPANLRLPQRADPADNGSHVCRNPLSLGAPDYSTNALAPCIEAGAAPTGPENAVRLVRATHLPEDAANNKIGFTLATDNRLYVYGDVNTDTSGAQGLQGKVSLIADSVTLMSQRFSDRVMQRGATSAAWEDEPYYVSHDAMVAGDNPHFDAGPSSTGQGPDVCYAWNTRSGLRARKSINLNVYASLLMGDVPDCPNAYDTARDGSSSGGVNNFPRFIEDHIYDEGGSSGSRRTVRILGSIVSLFRAEQGNSRFAGAMNMATTSAGHWVSGRTTDPYQLGGGHGCVYSAPFRDWEFDTALLDPTNLPPGTPRLVQIDRVRWVRR